MSTLIGGTSFPSIVTVSPRSGAQVSSSLEWSSNTVMKSLFFLVTLPESLTYLLPLRSTTATHDFAMRAFVHCTPSHGAVLDDWACTGAAKAADAATAARSQDPTFLMIEDPRYRVRRKRPQHTRA